MEGYRRWGVDLLQRLNGMFALAIWDREKRQLMLARDHAGIKPLFYCDDGQRLLFASEIKAILASGLVDVRPDRDGLHSFLTFGYTAAPRTGFEGIRQLLPGQMMLVDHQGTQVRSWFQLPYPSKRTQWTLEESVERLEQALQNATSRQLVSDVPLGAFLSGGLDSSAIVRSMTRSQIGTVDTFTVGFQEASFDESQKAKMIAERYSTDHHSKLVTCEDVGLLERIVEHAEDPIADNSLLPVYLLSQFARSKLTVALSGDGADELLAGYDTYRASEISQSYRRIPRWIRRFGISPMVRCLPASTKKYNFASMAQRFVQGAERDWPLDHCSWRVMIDPSRASQLYTAEFIQSLNEPPLDRYAATLEDAPDWLDRLEQQLHVDFRFHLPNDMLVKVDRMSMAHSLEVRVPFLDREVIETALAIPSAWKRQGKIGKVVLRKLLSKDLGAEITDGKKAGFVIPIERWLRDDWFEYSRGKLDRTWCEASGIFRWPEVDKMLQEHRAGRRDHAYGLFTMLFCSLWWRRWIAGEKMNASDGNVVATNIVATKVRRWEG